MPSGRQCPYCNGEISATANFCGFCGRPLTCSAARADSASEPVLLGADTLSSAASGVLIDFDALPWRFASMVLLAASLVGMWRWPQWLAWLLLLPIACGTLAHIVQTEWLPRRLDALGDRWRKLAAECNEEGFLNWILRMFLRGLDWVWNVTAFRRSVHLCTGIRLAVLTFVGYIALIVLSVVLYFAVIAAVVIFSLLLVGLVFWLWSQLASNTDD